MRLFFQSFETLEGLSQFAQALLSIFLERLDFFGILNLRSCRLLTRSQIFFQTAFGFDDLFALGDQLNMPLPIGIDLSLKLLVLCLEQLQLRVKFLLCSSDRFLLFGHRLFLLFELLSQRDQEFSLVGYRSLQSGFLVCESSKLRLLNFHFRFCICADLLDLSLGSLMDRSDFLVGDLPGFGKLLLQLG